MLYTILIHDCIQAKLFQVRSIFTLFLVVMIFKHALLFAIVIHGHIH
jgi:hypothetical protein